MAIILVSGDQQKVSNENVDNQVDRMGEILRLLPRIERDRETNKLLGRFLSDGALDFLPIYWTHKFKLKMLGKCFDSIL